MLYFKKPGIMILCLIILTIFTLPGFAAVPGQITFQGKLTDLTGEPVADGSYAMRFYLFDAITGGTQLWNPPNGEEHNVDVNDGIYTVQLGADHPLNSLIFSNGTAWLEIAVYNQTTAAWETLSPRQPVTSVAYALKAGDSDTLEGNSAADLDTRYVNENQSGAITSTMIADYSVSSADLAANSVTASKITKNAVGTSEVADNSITADDLAHDAVTDTKISWPMDHLGYDLNGGILSLINDAPGSNGNYPMGIYGEITGAPTGSYPVMGVFGGAPGLGHGAPMSKFPGIKIGVGGASDTGYGIAGVSTSGYGVYGYSRSSTAGYFKSDYGGGRGVYAVSSNTGNYYNYGGYFSAAGVFGRGVYGTASGNNGYGVYGYSINGDGIYGQTKASDEHAGYFYTSDGSGLSGAALYARTYNSSGNGIALWAHNAYTTSTDATAVLSNDGTGALLKGFGGNGGEDEFRFNNDGTLLFYNADHVRTIALTPSESGTIDGGLITLYNSNNKVTAELDGDYSDYGLLKLMNATGDYRVTLKGSSYGGGGLFLKNNTGNTTISIYGDYAGTGDGRVITNELQITGGSDLSEQFDIKPARFEIAPGMVVSIDPDAPGHLQISHKAYDKKVAGIISGAGGIKTGMMMGQKGTCADGHHPVALTGRVYCWADTTSGPIQPGDLLTTSSVPGQAMKVIDFSRANGTILGKAMTSLKKGKGLILVLVSLQ